MVFCYKNSYPQLKKPLQALINNGFRGFTHINHSQLLFLSPILVHHRYTLRFHCLSILIIHPSHE